jgi:transcriptional regulator with XRE-family HTH domain
MDYGRAIRIVRTAYGLSQGELADRLSIGPSHLSLLEAGKRKPSLEVLEEVSKELKVPMHLMTLLASDAADLEDGRNADEVAALARDLLRILVSGGEQPSLPIKPKRSA